MPGTGASGPVDIGGASATGPRSDNQDRWAATADLALLSDGIGGHEGGAHAAERSVASALQCLAGAAPATRELVERAFAAANDAVRRDRSGALERMGATLTVAAMLGPDDGDDAGSRWCVAHVGDSPAFVVRGTAATRVTADHTVPGQMLRQGLLSDAEAEAHPYRNMLLQAVGIEEQISPDVVEVHLAHDDAIVLTSDGVSGVVPADVIAGIVGRSGSATAAAESLVGEAIRRDAHDNVTAVVVRRVPSSTGVRLES